MESALYSFNESVISAQRLNAPYPEIVIFTGNDANDSKAGDSDTTYNSEETGTSDNGKHMDDEDRARPSREFGVCPLPSEDTTAN